MLNVISPSPAAPVGSEVDPDRARLLAASRLANELAATLFENLAVGIDVDEAREQALDDLRALLVRETPPDETDDERTGRLWLAGEEAAFLLGVAVGRRL